MNDQIVKDWIEQRLAGRSSVELTALRVNGQRAKPLLWASQSKSYVLIIDRVVNGAARIEYILDFIGIPASSEAPDRFPETLEALRGSHTDLSDMFSIRVSLDGTILTCVYQLLGSETQPGVIFSAERMSGSYTRIRGFLGDIIDDIQSRGWAEFRPLKRTCQFNRAAARQYFSL